MKKITFNSAYIPPTIIKNSQDNNNCLKKKYPKIIHPVIRIYKFLNYNF